MEKRSFGMGIKSFAALIFSALVFSLPAWAIAVVGKPAPDFTAIDIEGETVQLSKLKGNIVVLEWNNPECPFVKKFYGAGAMQQLQKDAAGKKAMWISINSGAAGKQGHMDAAAAKAYVNGQGAAPMHYILDPEGAIGKSYDAKTTPHMFVIDKDGNIAYMGAIDDKPSTDATDIKSAKNYVMAAIDSLAAGKPVEVASVQAYGCNVKY
jgi:glutathione peroxidase-family protein